MSISQCLSFQICLNITLRHIVINSSWLSVPTHRRRQDEDHRGSLNESANEFVWPTNWRKYFRIEKHTISISNLLQTSYHLLDFQLVEGLKFTLPMHNHGYILNNPHDSNNKLRLQMCPKNDNYNYIEEIILSQELFCMYCNNNCSQIKIVIHPGNLSLLLNRRRAKSWTQY